MELKKIYPEAPIYTTVFDAKQAQPFARFDVRTSYLQRLPLVKRKREILIPLAPLAFEQFDLSKYDLVISSSHMAAKGVLTKPQTIHISYCHTPPRYLWEPHLDPRAKGGRLAWLRDRTAHQLRIWDRLAADRVDYFLANSEYIAKRIKKYYDRDSVVVYPPVDIEKFKPASADKVEDYYLFVSRLVGYKKCELVVDAFNDCDLPLVVIGQGPNRKRLERKANKNIRFLGYISDESMKKYYARAKAFIFPAEEDFGLVPVEAMAAGRPVIAYGGGGALETVEEGVTGQFFAEQTAQCLIDALHRFDAGQYDPERIRRHALGFSAERFRENIKNEVEKVVKRGT